MTADSVRDHVQTSSEWVRQASEPFRSDYVLLTREVYDGWVKTEPIYVNRRHVTHVTTRTSREGKAKVQVYLVSSEQFGIAVAESLEHVMGVLA